METSLPLNDFHCTQCGGEIHPDEGQIFLTCPYCGAAVYLDRSVVVFHWYLAPTLDEGKARASLARWMAGNQTVKDLDQKAQITGSAFEYFPLWFFKCRQPDGKEVILMEPAAATSVSELRNLNLPAGDLRKYDESEVGSQATTPNVPLETALRWVEQQQIAPGAVSERSLVHVPIYTFKYTYKGNTYTAIVEAGTGCVFANIYPAKAEAPYLLAGGLTALVYLCLAIIPLIGAASGGDGAWIGLLICAGLGLLVAPFLFALAVYVAAKI